MKKKYCSFLVAVSFLLNGGYAAAGYVNYFEDGTTWTTDGLTGFTTAGSDMVGMNVTATFADNTFQTIAWNVSDQGVKGTGWGLSLSSFNSSTFSNLWKLQSESTLSSAVTNIFLDGLGGKTIFDVSSRDADVSGEGTVASASGNTFRPDLSSAANYDVSATYSDLVAIAGADPAGDLYKNLSIDFNYDGFGGDGFSGVYQFYADTDNASTELTGSPSPVPEPTTMLLFGTGLAGIIGSRFKKRKKQDS